MAWDEQGNLRCGNETVYGCASFTARGSQAITDARARLHHWKIFGGDAMCPECAKPARTSRTSGSIEQDQLPGIVFPEVPKVKKTRRSKREAS
jgi:hypothetical protein